LRRRGGAGGAGGTAAAHPRLRRGVERPRRHAGVAAADGEARQRPGRTWGEALILPPKLRIGLRMRRSLPVLCLGLLVGGCQLAGRAPERVDPVAVIAPRAPSAVEEAIGARENPRVVAEYGGVYSDPDVELAIAKVVSRLVAVSDDPSR